MKKGYIGYALLLIVLLASAGILTSSAALAAEKRAFSKSCSLDLLPVAKDFKRMRFSSFDTSGGNSDNVRIGHAETKVIASTTSPGCIKHIWCTFMADGIDEKLEKYYLRKIVIRMFWDNAPIPSVEVPLGDFFGMGHGMRRNFVSAPLQMSPENGSALNCWFPMPFSTGARIEIENQCQKAIKVYYYIDWEKYDTLDDDLLRFHASWNREITKGISEKGIGQMEFQDSGVNKTGEGNYVILAAEGEGHYVGCNVNIHNQRLSWYWDWPGEGDDMIFVDGEKWPPQIHGTGTEDYFNGAFCPTQPYNAPYHGIILGGGVNWASKITYYRYHILDPITFKKSIQVTIEHGHANRRSDDWSSTAYWYQKGIGKIKRLPRVEARLPLEDRWTFNRVIANIVLWPIYKLFYSM